MSHQVVSHDEWLTARRALLAEEKALSKARDRVSEHRRAMPWVQIQKAYSFDSPVGRVSLADLFAGRDQLIVQHFMLAPGWEEGCIGCSFCADHVDGMLPHLAARNVTFVAVSRAPLAEILAFKRRMGWKFDWVSSQGTDFNADFHVTFSPEAVAAGPVDYNFGPNTNTGEEMPGISVFYRDADGSVLHTYSAYARGMEPMVGTYDLLDMTPLGRQEKINLGDWVHLHDAYDDAKSGPACCHGA